MRAAASLLALSFCKKPLRRLLGFRAPTSGDYLLAVYDYHHEGSGPVPVELKVNDRPPGKIGMLS